MFAIDSEPNVHTEASSFTLSYLGDAWYEIWCRQHVISLTQNPALAHSQVVRLVRCQTQARLIHLLFPSLTKTEQHIYQRGKNYRLLTRPKHATMKEYRDATGFECLVGYWYLQQDIQRFEECMNLEAVQHFLDETLKEAIKNG